MAIATTRTTGIYSIYGRVGATSNDKKLIAPIQIFIGDQSNDINDSIFNVKFGKILQTDGFPPAPGNKVNPVVVVNYEPSTTPGEQVVPLTSFEDISVNIVPPSSISDGTEVQILGPSSTIQGKIIQLDDTSNIIAKDMPFNGFLIDVYIVTDFSAPVTNTDLLGSSVVLKSNGQLVGMFMHQINEPVRKIGYIYPAHEVLARA